MPSPAANSTRATRARQKKSSKLLQELASLMARQAEIVVELQGEVDHLPPPAEKSDREAQDVDPLDVVELERNLATTLPAGWKLGQPDPKQPSTAYAEFKREILNEIARAQHVPYPSELRRGMQAPQDI